MKKTFYYNFKPLNLWLLFNVGITLLVCSCFVCGWRILIYPQMWVILGCVIFSWGVWYYKYIHPQIMAIITDESIKIDHANPVKWEDIDHAEEKIVWCWFKQYRVLALVPKENTNYQYNWLQKHNPFPAFSVPLYGLLTAEDEKEITEIVSEKVKLISMKE